MIKFLWIAGILIALSTFGIKVGLGASAICYNRIIPGRRKFFFLLGIFLLYSFLFFSLYSLTAQFQLLNYLDRFLQVLRYGMVIHLLIALGLIFWGVNLLLRQAPLLQRERSSQAPQEALLLVFPCPVCAVVILLTISLAHSVLPFSLLHTTGLLFGIFFIISLATVAMLFPFRRQIGKADSSFLGLVMVIVALYFFLMVLIAPVYQEAQDVYRLASRNTGNPSLDLKSFLILLSVVAAFFSIGFFRQFRVVGLVPEPDEDGKLTATFRGQRRPRILK